MHPKTDNVRVVIVMIAAMTLMACNTRQAELPAASAADLVITNAKVKTPEGWAEALAVKDGKIHAVGNSSMIDALVSDSTKVFDVEGKVVLPGFHDLHVHPVYGGIMYSGADKSDCLIAQGSTQQQLVNTVSACVERVDNGSWVTGGQWDASTIGRVPDRTMLDPVSPTTPILLNDTSGHSALANSVALQIAGVTADTPNPEGGIVERDAYGNPTGVLRETAIGLVRSHVPPPSDAILRESLEWSLNNMLSYGITSFTEASSGFVGGAKREAELFTALANDGILKQRVRVCMNWMAETWDPDGSGAPGIIENRKSYERERLRFDCVKIFLDGVPTDSHTAAMVEPYADTIEGRDDAASRFGLLLVDQEVTNRVVTDFDRQGLTVKFHAAGDAAVRSGLDAIEAARAANGDTGVRHDVAHCTFIHPEDIARARDIDATFELSPYLFSPSPINDDITAAIGTERIERVWPFREAIDSGALVVVGSDWSVVPSVNPWIAVETMVTREEVGGSARSFGKSQAIRVDEAIELFTVNAARHTGREGDLGKLAKGMLADFIVIDRDPYTTPVTQLHETQVLMTFIEGEKVYDSADAMVTAQ